MGYVAGLNKKNGTNRHILVWYNSVSKKYDLYDVVTHKCINGDYSSLEDAQQAASLYWYSNDRGCWTCD